MAVHISDQYTKRFYTWTAFKAQITAKGLILQFDEAETKYTIWGYDGPEVHMCEIFKGNPPSGTDETANSSALTEFEASYKPTGNKKLTQVTDTENAVINRLKMAPAGWTYQLRCIEFETSVMNSVVDGVNTAHLTVKFYNASNVEITDQAILDTDCVKTVLDFEPTYDFEIVGGTIKSANTVAQNIRLTVIGVPDVPAAYGGSKIMVSSANLYFVDPGNGIQADGRVSKFMKYDAIYHTNKIRFSIAHPAGHKLRLSVFLEHYKQ